MMQLKIKKYRKKPVVIEAVQYTGKNLPVISNFVGDEWLLMNEEDSQIPIHTLEGDHLASPGDYIIKGVKGEYYPCKPDIFGMTYDEVFSDDA